MVIGALSLRQALVAPALGLNRVQAGMYPLLRLQAQDVTYGLISRKEKPQKAPR